MDIPPKTSEPDRGAWTAGTRIAAIYGVVGALWIALSDRLLLRLVDDPARWALLQTYKGWLFVAASAILLALLVTRQMRHLQAERAQVQRLNRTYRLLSGINSALVRVRNREEFLQTTCRLAVEQGGFRLVRIVLREHARGPLAVAHCCGEEDCNLFPTQTPLVDVFPLEPERSALVIHWRGDALPMRVLGTVTGPLGVRAIAALPIPAQSGEGLERGWLELFSSVDANFDVHEIALLREVAGDIGLGLTMIETAAQMEALAHYDALTGLPNEVLLADRLRQAVARAHFDHRSVGVIVADVPELMRIDDIHGQTVGDRCRKGVAEFLAGAVREGDTITRTGRYEFTMVLSDMARSADLVELSNQLLRGPELRLDTHQHPLRLGLRGGAALYPDDADNAHDLQRYAALALHARAVAVGNCTFYSPALDALAQERLRLEYSLNHALERDELSLVYQLLFDTRTQRAVGGEALLRWHNETAGDVSPGRFIPIAEESGAIHSIGDWVLEQACRQLKIWSETLAGPFHLSVNVAPPQLLREGFVESVRAIVRRTEVGEHVSALALEVTETALLHDLERAVSVLHSIRALGIKIYLDDFGTGYSSLNYLSRLPIDVLKIDRSFIHEVPGNRRSGTLVKSIIALAHSLGIKVVAEGVENQAQQRFLSYLNCDILQGYLFHRPSPAAQLAERVAAIGS